MDSARQRVLILKLGYTETLDEDAGGIVSLGDVLRTTVILHLFPPQTHHVTWIVDPKAFPLLEGNPLIDHVIPVNAFTPLHLQSAHWDIVINLEKDPGVCAMADRIPAWRHYGFRFDPISGGACAHEYADIAMNMSADGRFKREQGRSWSEILYTMLDQTYVGQPYVLGRKPHSHVTHDVGLNHLVGKKYPLKRWPEEHWQGLNSQLTENNYQVSWQQGENSIEDYIDWINSCRVIVTNDSLGLHLALALGKKVVVLFGPTIDSEIDESKDVIRLTPDVNWDCMPCLENQCVQPVLCMNYIDVDRVTTHINQLLA